MCARKGDKCGGCTASAQAPWYGNTALGGSSWATEQTVPRDTMAPHSQDELASTTSYNRVTCCCRPRDTPITRSNCGLRARLQDEPGKWGLNYYKTSKAKVYQRNEPNLKLRRKLRDITQVLAASCHSVHHGQPARHSRLKGQPAVGGGSLRVTGPKRKGNVPARPPGVRYVHAKAEQEHRTGRRF